MGGFKILRKTERDSLSLARKLLYDIGSYSRSCGSEGIRRARDRVKGFLRSLGIDFKSQSFKVKKRIPVAGKVEVGKETYEGIPFVGSKSNTFEGLIGRDLELLPYGKRGGKDNQLLYLEHLNEFYVGYTEGGTLLSIKREVVKSLEGKFIRVDCLTQERELIGENILFEVGRGESLFLVAHLDTRPFVKGTVDNALSVVLILILAKELLRESLKYRLKFLITDCGEMGLEGSRFFVENSKEDLNLCINLDSIGWHNPALLYRDGGGFNGGFLMEKFLKFLKDYPFKVRLRASKGLRGDHVPFKEAGADVLFLTSYPFTFKHTSLDNLSAVSWENFKNWYNLLRGFLLELPKL